MTCDLLSINLTCTMLLKQIEGFYHGIKYSYWLVVIPCLAGICKDAYIVVHVGLHSSTCDAYIDCGI